MIECDSNGSVCAVYTDERTGIEGEAGGGGMIGGEKAVWDLIHAPMIRWILTFDCETEMISSVASRTTINITGTREALSLLAPPPHTPSTTPAHRKAITSAEQFRM